MEEVSERVTDLKEYTEAQFVITAEQILAEVTRATQAEASLSIRVDGIVASVTNLKNDTNSKFEQTAEQISLKVSKGDVSSQLSVESDKVTISGNRLIVNSTNFQLDGDGNATFSGRVQGAQVIGSIVTGGAINIGNGAFYVDSSGNAVINAGEINLGNVYINPNYAWINGFGIADNIIYSRDSGNSIQIATSSYPEWGEPHISLAKGNSKTDIGPSMISTSNLWIDNDVYFKDPWTEGMSLLEMLKDLYGRVSR